MWLTQLQLSNSLTSDRSSNYDDSTINIVVAITINTAARRLDELHMAGCFFFITAQRRLLGITWRDKVRNENIRKNTGLRKLEDIIKERRLRWLGHILRMDNSKTARQATQWELRGHKRKPGRPRKNWMDVIKRDLKNMHLTS